MVNIKAMPTTSEDACFWYVYSLAVYRISIIFIFLSDEVYANASHFVCPNERGIFSTLYTAYHRKKIFKGLVALTIVSKWFLMFFTDTCYLPIENVDVYIKIWVFLNLFITFWMYLLSSRRCILSFSISSYKRVYIYLK